MCHAADVCCTAHVVVSLLSSFLQRSHWCLVLAAIHALHTLSQRAYNCCQHTQVAELQQSLLLALLPQDVEDDGNVILEIRSSVGGDWAGGFAADLLDMYRLFAAEHGWRFEVGVVCQLEVRGVGRNMTES